MGTSTELAVMSRVFVFEENEVRVVIKAGEPWWVLSDVCKALELGNAPAVASRLKDNQKDTVILNDSVNRPHQNTIINEFALYKVIMRSDKPEAERFQDWVCEEVLPQIRKTGFYRQFALPTDYEEALEQLLAKERERKALVARVERNLANMSKIRDVVEGDALLAKCDYVNRALMSNQPLEVPLGEASAVLNLPFGRNTLYEILREWGWVLQDSTVPSSYARDKGWLLGKESIQYDKYGGCHRYTVTFATLRGRLKILKELIKRGQLVETARVASLIAELKRLIAEYEAKDRDDAL